MEMLSASVFRRREAKGGVKTNVNQPPSCWLRMTLIWKSKKMITFEFRRTTRSYALLVIKSFVTGIIEYPKNNRQWNMVSHQSTKACHFWQHGANFTPLWNKITQSQKDKHWKFIIHNYVQVILWTRVHWKYHDDYGKL